MEEEADEETRQRADVSQPLYMQAVSYTHLDVYKRQAYTMRVIAGSARRLNLKTIEGLDTRHTTDTVSYTHLDVYKRQVLRRVV